MTKPESESRSPLSPVMEGAIVTIGLVLFAFFVVTGQPFGLAFGATVSFIVIATLALFVIGRDEIVAESFDTTLPDLGIRSAPAVAKLPNKLTPACSMCKSEIAPTNKFCPECGHKLTAADFASPSP